MSIAILPLDLKIQLISFNTKLAFTYKLDAHQIPMMMAHWSWLSGNISSIPKWDLHIFEFSLGHVTLNKKLMYLRISL